MDTLKWLLLYSKTQNAYHIETTKDFNSKPKNGYQIIGEYHTYDLAVIGYETLIRV